MGDPSRFLKLLGHINGMYSPPMKVADVAGGRGTLNEMLTLEGYDVVTIDPDLRFKNPCLVGVNACFDHHMAIDYDLIVGMHPDGATEEIARAARYRPVILVPCCRIWEGVEMRATRSIRGTVEKFFGLNGIPFDKDYLDISGPNVVYSTPS